MVRDKYDTDMNNYPAESCFAGRRHMNGKNVVNSKGGY